MPKTNGGQAQGGTGRRLRGRLSSVADGLASWAEAGGQRPSESAASARTCPYCTERIDLRRCDVVSAATRTSRVPNQSEFDDLGSSPLAGVGSQTDGHVSGAPMRGGYEILFDAHPERSGRTSNSLFSDLVTGAVNPPRPVPLTQLAPPQKMPRRCCERCGSLLPAELDDLDTRFLAVVGVTGAGKTHYLAQALTEASRRGSLRRFGCSEFAPTDADNTAHTLHNDYYAPVVRQRILFSPTNPTEAPTQFNFTVAMGGRRFLLVTHDIAGESLADPAQRAQQLTFLRRADALIFLMDPAEFDGVRTRLPEHLLGPDKPADQTHLLRQCLRELDESSRHEVPVRLVVSKADLITNYCGISGLWERPPAPDWRDDLEPISDDVQRMLTTLGESEMVRLVSQRERALFHAVSSLGAPPEPDRRLARAEPLRCSDPLGAALLGMALTAAAGQ